MGDLKFQLIEVRDIKKFDFEKLMFYTSDTIRETIFKKSLNNMIPLLQEYKLVLEKLPAIDYFVSESKRVRIPMKMITPYLKLFQDERAIAIMFTIGFVTVQGLKVPIEELTSIIELGSASHRYPATGIYKKIKAKYTEKFNKVLTESLYDSFDSIVSYSANTFGKKLSGFVST